MMSIVTYASIVITVGIACLKCACCNTEAATSANDNPGDHSEWHRISLSEIGGRVVSSPFENVDSIGWLKDDELVVAGGGNLLVWNIAKRTPTWATVSPPSGCSEEEESDSRKEFFRLFTTKSSKGFLAAGWSQHSPKWKYLYRVIPGTGFQEIDCDEGSRGFQVGFRDEGNPAYTIWNPEGSAYAVSLKDSISVYDDNGSRIHRLIGENDPLCREIGGYRVFGWSPDGLKIVGKECFDGSIRIWDVMSGKVEDTVEAAGGHFIGAAWGKAILAVTDSGKILRYQYGAGSVEVKEYPKVTGGDNMAEVLSNWYPVQVNTSGEFFSISYVSKGKVTVHDWKGNPILTIDGFNARWREDSSTLAAIDESGRIRLVAIGETIVSRELEWITSYGIAARGENLRWSHSGRYLALICRHGVCVYDMENDVILYPICRKVNDRTIEGRLVKEGRT